MKRTIRMLGLIWMSLVTGPLMSQPCDCLNTGNCPVPINDNGSFQGMLDVTVDGPNDLGSCPLVQVCFDITHTWVGDLAITLTSPNGTNFILMGDDINGLGGPCGNEEDNLEVCITTGTGNPLSNNVPYVCNSGPCSSGTCCLTGAWTVACGGVTDPLTGAQQAPGCDLNDFNQAGAPANGTWTLTVNDVCANDVGTLNNFSLTFACGTLVCTVCEAEGGDLEGPDVTGCFGDSDLNLTLPPSYNNGSPANPGEYGYAYVISQNGIIIAVNPSADMSSQPPGVYTICGLSYLLVSQGGLQSLVGLDVAYAQGLLSSATAPFCGDFSDDCVGVTIGPVIPPSFIDTMVCLGDCIQVGDQEVCSSGTVVLDSWLGCDSVVEVIIVPIFIPPTTSDTVVCQGECLEIYGQVYCPPGPHPITYESWLGCDSVVTWFITEEPTEANILPGNPPALSCVQPVVQLDGSTSIPVTASYLWQGPGGFSSTDPGISVTLPGTYTLTISNNLLDPACTATASVQVTGNLEGPDLQVISMPPSLCEGDTFDLLSLNIVDLNNTDPVITFHSGTPASPANELSTTLIVPDTSTTYYILATTGVCSDETSVTVDVYPLPSAEFTVETPICRDSATTIQFTGSAGSSAIFNWSFSGGMAMPGTGPGPHQVRWLTGGQKTITLVVEENGCQSAAFTQTVMVVPPIPVPVVNCIPSNNSIEFVWNDIPAASGYEVTVAIGPPGTMTSDTSFLVTGLAPGDQSSIFVEAISANACGNSSTQITCTAQDCPPIAVSIEPVPDICLDAQVNSIALVASQTGGDGSGAFTWSGAGVNPFSGVFNPLNALTGENSIVVTYEEGTCLYNGSITINVNPQPTALFTVVTPVCAGRPSTINYTGNASSGASFLWDFDGGTANPGTGPGPHGVRWPAGGQYTVILSVEENGCLSEPDSAEIIVEAPVPVPDIMCVGNTSSVLFYWAPVAGADSLEVIVLAGPEGFFVSDTSYLIDGLEPGDVVSIEVVSFGDGVCGNSSVQANCTANDCPDVVLEIEPVPGICLDSDAQPFALTVNVTGSAGVGQLTFQGPGITDTLSGIFDPAEAALGSNLITVTYEENNCLFTEDIQINVFSLPVASFVADSIVCEGDEILVQYTGTLVPGLIFTWDFGVGMASPGFGQGPHTVSWTDGGQHMISLTMESAQGCVSELFSETIQVEGLLTPPDVSCQATTQTVEFTWTEVPGVTAYDITILSGQTGGVYDPPGSYLVSGLSPDEEVIIEMTLTGSGACPPLTIQESCTAIECPDVLLTITPVSGVCIDRLDPVDLEVLITGGTGAGTGAWSGPGIIDGTAGLFEAQQAGTGSHEITYAYQEGNCAYSQSITVEVFDLPQATFTATPVICIDGEAKLIYTGGASVDAVYAWEYGNAQAFPGVGGGVQTLSWNEAGVYEIILTVEQDGCESQPYSQFVQVDDTLSVPQIDCEVTEGSVSFSWDTIPGATGYDVTIISGQPGAFTSTGSYVVEGLVPEEAVIFELTVSGNTVCPPVIASATCAASACPAALIAELTIQPVSCFGFADGLIQIVDVSGGLEPYLFSLNGSPFGPDQVFPQLEPGVYDLIIMDANECQEELTINIEQPQELNVELVVYVEGSHVIRLGESVDMEGVVTLPEDSLDLVNWEPSGLVDCDTCLYVTASPVEQTTFSITVESNGCSDSDAVTIYVSKDHQVYVPNAFSPNEDGVNDRFMIYANPGQVSSIRSFLVFNRWGETVHRYSHFQPNDPASGWDGRHRGKPEDPAVFTWFAEIEFTDGVTKILEGDVTLIR